MNIFITVICIPMFLLFGFILGVSWIAWVNKSHKNEWLYRWNSSLNRQIDVTKLSNKEYRYVREYHPERLGL